MKATVTEGLLRKLKTTFPNQLPSNRDVTLCDIRERMGEQRVIDYIESLHTQQDPTEELLNDVLQARHP